MADAGLLVESPDKAGPVVENDSVDNVKHAESEVSGRESLAEHDEESKVNGHVQDKKRDQPTEKEAVAQHLPEVKRADEERPSAAESKSEKADVKDVKKEQPTKKESVAECLRRYREEEAKARRAADEEGERGGVFEA